MACCGVDDVSIALIFIHRKYNFRDNKNKSVIICLLINCVIVIREKIRESHLKALIRIEVAQT
jgi:hypothetical protein